jgi:hypothetical protein
MQFNPNIVEQAARRWQERETSRQSNKQELDKGNVVGVEKPERIQARLERLSINAAREQSRLAEAAAPAGVTTPSASFLIERVGFERVLGKSDFLNTNFLELALAVSRFVGRINIKSSRTSTVGFGTGFMVSPRLLLTNNHVLSTRQEAVFSMTASGASCLLSPTRWSRKPFSCQMPILILRSLLSAIARLTIKLN